VAVAEDVAVVGVMPGWKTVPREFYGLITSPNIHTMEPRANARLSVLQPDSVLVDLYRLPWLLVVAYDGVYEFRFDGQEWEYRLLASL